MKDVWSAWEPVRADIQPQSAEIGVWNRAYRFEESVFPTSVTAGGEELLARPIELVGRYAGAVERRVSEASYFELEKSDERAVFQLASRMGNTVIDGRMTCDFDGFIEICFSVIPFWSFSKNGDNAPRLDKLYIDIPMKKRFARLYHYWPNAATSIIPDPNVVNADALPESGAAFPFKPYLWLGDEFRGLGVSMESDESIEADGNVCEFIPNGDEVILRIHLLDHMPEDWQGRVDRWIDALTPIDYRIGLMATPVKPVTPAHRRDWRAFHAFGNMYINDAHGAKAAPAYLNEMPGALERLEKGGVKWIIFHESSSRAQNYGLIEDPERFRRLIEDCHKHGIKTMLYFGYEFSTLAPTWFEKSKDYLIRTPNGHFTGGWQRKPDQRAFMVCYRGGYSADMIERVKFIMDEYGVDGIYTDGTFVPWECANERHGCGYTDRNGKRHATFPLFAVRDHVRKLYEAVHERGGLIDTHQSSCCIAPTLAYCDSYYDGENIQGALIRSITEGRGLTSFLSLPAFRTEYMGKNLGLIDQFIAYTNPEIGWTIEKLCALTLIHDVIPRPRQIGAPTAESMAVDLDYIEKIWRAFDEFGVEDAAWLPYWEQNDVAACETKDAYLSLYRGARVLGVLSNLATQSQTVRVRTDKPSVENVLTGEVYAAKDGRIEFVAESYKPYLLAL